MGVAGAIIGVIIGVAEVTCEGAEAEDDADGSIMDDCAGETTEGLGLTMAPTSALDWACAGGGGVDDDPDGSIVDDGAGEIIEGLGVAMAWTGALDGAGGGGGGLPLGFRTLSPLKLCCEVTAAYAFGTVTVSESCATDHSQVTCAK